MPRREAGIFESWKFPDLAVVPTQLRLPVTPHSPISHSLYAHAWGPHHWVACFLGILLTGAMMAQPTWVEDFKNPIGGFDHGWIVAQPSGSTSQVELQSNGEIGRLKIQGELNAYASITTSQWIDWNTQSNRWIQILVPNLEFGERIKVLAHSSKAIGGWAILHDEWLEIPGQGPQPQTIDVNASIPTGTQQILLMIEIVDNIWGDPPNGAEVHIDWIKAGMPGEAAMPEDAPVPTTPIEGETVNGYPVLGWRPPNGFQGNRYSISLSQDPLFSGTSTITLLDRVIGTNVSLSSKLSAGRWYWKVSATGVGGLSGPFSRAASDPAFDPRDPRSRRYPSFIVQEDKEQAQVSRPFATRLGSQGFRAQYQFSTDPVLVEQAKECLRLGSQSYKFLLGWDQYRTVYPDLPELPPSKRKSLLDIVENEKAYTEVFEMPFRFYCMWTYAMGIPYWHFRDGLSDAHAQAEYQQVYDLTRHLISRYQNTGKAFLIGHWEGDWVLLEGYDYHGIPRERMIEGMTEWYRMRQKAVDDARNSLPGAKGVSVYHYAEVNLVEKALQGMATVASRVLPQVAVDAVSYSAYDATNYRLEMPSRLHRHLDFLWWNSRFTGAWPHGRPVFIGEFGLGGNDRVEAGLSNLAAVRAAQAWGCPLVQFWSVYESSVESTSSLIDSDSRSTEDHRTLRRSIVGGAHLRGASMAWLGREPLEEEYNAFGAQPDVHLGSQALRFVLACPRFRSGTSNQEFIDAAFRRMTRGFDAGSPLAVELVAGLESGAMTRWSCLISILDSSAFRSAISDREFSRYLNGISSGVWDSAAPLPPGPRSSLYLRALDDAPFADQSVAHGISGVSMVVDSLRWASDLALNPVLLAWSTGDSGLAIEVYGQTRGRYRVEVCADLETWVLIAIVVAIDGSAPVPVVVDGVNDRFFRVVAD